MASGSTTANRGRPSRCAQPCARRGRPCGQHSGRSADPRLFTQPARVRLLGRSGNALLVSARRSLATRFQADERGDHRQSRSHAPHIGRPHGTCPPWAPGSSWPPARQTRCTHWSRGFRGSVAVRRRDRPRRGRAAPLTRAHAGPYQRPQPTLSRYAQHQRATNSRQACCDDRQNPPIVNWRSDGYAVARGQSGSTDASSACCTDAD
jgi:hypothetical protein